MTDREMLKIMISHCDDKRVIVEKDRYVEVEDSYYGENISFEFDENGQLTDIY